MLEKVKTSVNDGKEINIEQMKIYWDTETKQYRHKFNCCNCKEPHGCRCYETLDEAIEGVDNGIICEECGISEALSNVEISDLIDILDEPRQKHVNEFLKTLVTAEEIKTYMDEAEITDLSDVDYIELIEEVGKEQELREYVESQLTREEKIDEWVNSSDCYAEGEQCDI
jgi:hypothetical protein